jgi:hypothetical protein
LVTYTAQAATSAERMLGVWIVEKARDEHLAAVNFLNEISPARVGWVPAEVRFVRGPAEADYVQFEPTSRPNVVQASAPPVMICWGVGRYFASDPWDHSVPMVISRPLIRRRWLDTHRDDRH